MAIDKQQLRNAETDSGIAVPSPAAGMYLSYYIFQRWSLTLRSVATDSGMAVPSPAAGMYLSYHIFQS